MSDLSELEELVRTSTREVLDDKWVEDEMMAIRILGGAPGMMRLKRTGLKYTNWDHSSVAYLIGITDYSPAQPCVRVHTGRVEPPDVDLDFEDARRDEIKRYLGERWKHVASISTFNKFTAKGLVRDLSRVLGIPIEEVNRVCKRFNTMDEFIELPETKAFRQKYPEVPELAIKFEGRWRSQGVHAAGVVVSNRALEKLLPMESRSIAGAPRIRVTAYDMDDCARLGLIKMDVLGVSQLTVIEDCLDSIKERHGREVNIDSIPLNDPVVIAEFSKGHTAGVFQADAPAYTNLLRRMGIDSFSDLVVSNALVRPGPLLTVGKVYIQRKKGFEPTPKEHPAIEEITSETYNVFIFQEQLLEALVKIGKFSWAEADRVRKIIGKKRDPEEFKKYEEKWMQNAPEIIGKQKANQLWKDFVKFAGYAFNKSHSAAYSLFSYQTMWLKVHFPTEYIFSLLKNEKDSDKVTSHIIEAQRLGIPMLMPDVNRSGKFFQLEGDSIRFGLCNIKGVGEASADEIINKRPFESLEDLVVRVNGRACNQRVRTLLEQVGAIHSDHRCGDLPDVGDDILYELLSLPRSMESDYDLGIMELTPIGQYDPDKIQIIRGVIKRVSRYERYNRFELQDSTGTMPLYCNDDAEEGQLIIGLAHGTGLSTFTIESEFVHRLKNNLELLPIERYLRGELLQNEAPLYDHGVGKIGTEKALVIPVWMRRFETKKGLRMAHMIVWDGEITDKIVVFPTQYAKYASVLQPFVPIVIKVEELKDGTRCLQRDGLMPATTLLRMKGLTR